jgi:hypothetical protein
MYVCSCFFVLARRKINTHTNIYIYKKHKITAPFCILSVWERGDAAGWPPFSGWGRRRRTPGPGRCSWARGTGKDGRWGSRRPAGSNLFEKKEDQISRCRVDPDLDSHWSGCLGSVLGMRIRIRVHGNWPKLTTKPGFLLFKKGFCKIPVPL